MAELTKLESKLGEVTGLAMAAQAATRKVIGLTGDGDGELVAQLERMHREAAETEERCTSLAAALDGKKTAILQEARSTKSKAAAMMGTYLDADSDALDGFEFLTMAEAAEVGHWSVLKALNATARHGEIRSLVAWALPIQRRHFAEASTGSLKLAREEDPDSPA